MEIREIKEGDVVVLVPGASVTGNDETRAIEAKLEVTLKAGAKFLVVDCGAVTQLTSAAVRVFLAVSRRLDRIGGRLVLCDMNAQLKKAFSISGVDKDFTVAMTREEGLHRVLEPLGSQRLGKSAAVTTSPPTTGVPLHISEEPSVVIQSAPVVDADKIAAPTSPAKPASSAPPLSTSSTSAAASAAVTRHAALAAALLEALDVPAVRVEAAGDGQTARPDSDALANGLLAALRTGGSWLPDISSVQSVRLRGEV